MGSAEAAAQKGQFAFSWPPQHSLNPWDQYSTFGVERHQRPSQAYLERVPTEFSDAMKSVVRFGRARHHLSYGSWRPMDSRKTRKPTLMEAPSDDSTSREWEGSVANLARKQYESSLLSSQSPTFSEESKVPVETLVRWQQRGSADYEPKRPAHQAWYSQDGTGGERELSNMEPGKVFSVLPEKATFSGGENPREWRGKSSAEFDGRDADSESQQVEEEQSSEVKPWQQRGSQSEETQGEKSSEEFESPYRPQRVKLTEDWQRENTGELRQQRSQPTTRQEQKRSSRWQPQVSYDGWLPSPVDWERTKTRRSIGDNVSGHDRQRNQTQTEREFAQPKVADSGALKRPLGPAPSGEASRDRVLKRGVALDGTPSNAHRRSRYIDKGEDQSLKSSP